LLAATKSAEQSDFSHRFQALAPEVDQVFDLPAILVVSVGPNRASFSPDQQNRLLAAFRRYTVVSYLANFKSYAGQSFTVSPDTYSRGSGRVVVQSRIVMTRGEATELDYVMNQTSACWKVVDVLAVGSISRVWRCSAPTSGASCLTAAAMRCWRASSVKPPIFRGARSCRTRTGSRHRTGHNAAVNSRGGRLKGLSSASVSDCRGGAREFPARLKGIFAMKTNRNHFLCLAAVSVMVLAAPVSLWAEGASSDNPVGIWLTVFASRTRNWPIIRYTCPSRGSESAGAGANEVR
jgi:MlaC protein